MESQNANSTETQALGTGSFPPGRLGVALSGGGARGFAHAGALLAIEEAGLKPDMIAGVSAGSIVAVLYGAGLSPLDIAQLFANSNLRSFADLSFGHGALMRIDKFGKFIAKAIHPYKLIEELKTPVYLGATNFDAGIPTYFDKGEIIPRMMASCSIPIVFKPVTIDGVRYVDGGVLRNHPAWIIRDKCDFLIGVNVSPLSVTGEMDSLLEVALRTYNLMAKANQADDMRKCDISVETPDIAHYAVFNLKNIKNIFLSGYIHTRKALRDAGLWHPKGPAPQLPNPNQP